MRQKVHYVYHLFVGRSLVYVGRTIDPNKRRAVFERRTNLAISKVVLYAFSSFSAAQIQECLDIAKLRPKFNKRVISSRGTLGKKHTADAKQRIGAANKGKPRNDLARARLSRGVRKAIAEGRGHGPGSTMSTVARRKISKANTGHKCTAETRHRLSAAVRLAIAQGRPPGKPFLGPHTASAKRKISKGNRLAWKRRKGLA